VKNNPIALKNAWWFARLAHLTTLEIGILMQVHRISHPLVEHHLAVIRNGAVPSSGFRESIAALAMLVGVRATEDLPTCDVSVTTPLTMTTCRQLAVRVALVPILRAGLGLVDPMLRMIPTAEVWHLGLYRNEETAQPVSYYDKLSAGNPTDVGLILDPMLATGGSILLALERLRQWGVRDVRVLSIIAAQPGIERVSQADKNVKIYVAAIDPELNDRSYIVPGLGDAGDRLFNTCN
jgi:uracil phosphoribosyltransferase